MKDDEGIEENSAVELKKYTENWSPGRYTKTHVRKMVFMKD